MALYEPTPEQVETLDWLNNRQLVMASCYAADTGVVVNQDWRLRGRVIRHRVGRVLGKFEIRQEPEDLKNFPKQVDKNVNIFLTLSGMTMMPLLLSTFTTLYVMGKRELLQGHERDFRYKVKKILMKGRVEGKMPRGLIPGKINELRELDEANKVWLDAKLH
jgi:hypothetical protein